jgi:hypothetical protein
MNTLAGGAGDDSIVGGSNHDDIAGGTGNDVLSSDIGIFISRRTGLWGHWQRSDDGRRRGGCVCVRHKRWN